MRYLLVGLFVVSSFYLKGQEAQDSCVNKSCWTLMYNSFEEALGVSPSNFQMILPFVQWNWEATKDGNTNSKEYNLLNGIPVWNDTGKYQSGSDFSLAYETFLFTLVFRIDSSLYEESEAQKRKVVEVADEYAKLAKEAHDKYEEDKDALSFELWLQKPYSIGYVYHQKLLAEKKNLDTQDSLYTDYLSQLRDTLLVYSRERYEKVDYRTTVSDASISNSLLRPAYASIGDPQEWVKKKADNCLTMSWNMKGGECGLKFIDLDSGKEHLLANDSVTFQMVIENWDTLPVKPLPWFNESLIRAKGNNPNAFRQGYAPYYDEENQKGWIFGEGGIIPSRVTDLLVGYKFRLKITGYSHPEGDVQTISKGDNYAIESGNFVLKGKVKEVQKSGEKINLMLEHDSQYPFFFGVYIHRY